LKFILEIKSVENESIYKFTSNFSDKERKIICLFLELYSIITKNKSYNEFNEDLQNYLTDLPYEERLTFINERLNMILENQIIKYMFIITAELIKETSLEIDYIIEEIMNNDEENLSDLIKNLFETLRIPEREILINTLKCIKQQNNNGKIENYIEELEQMKDNEEKQSIYNNVSDSFEAIKRVLNETRDKNEVFDSFSKLKNTLYGICKDLFYFVDQCKIGKFNFRKIKAISPIKVEIIKKLLDIEYMFKKNNNIKSAIEILKNLKLNEKK
jgi:predicted Zn-ribbon and HTH transcriptional regulator